MSYKSGEDFRGSTREHKLWKECEDRGPLLTRQRRYQNVKGPSVCLPFYIIQRRIQTEESESY